MGLYILFFVIYIVVVLTIGIISSRKETEEDFMIAERKVKGVQLAATMTAGFFDSAVLSVYVAYLYQYGFSAIWIFVGIIVGFIILRIYAARIKQKADTMKVYSMPEYFFKILGKKNGLMFSIFLVIQFIIFLIINFIVAGKVLSAIFPVHYAVAVIFGGLIILTYLLMAGFKAVIRTDFFQLIITFVMALTVGIFLFGRTHIPASDINLTSLGTGNIIGFLILGGLSTLVAPDLWQRMFASKDKKTLNRGLWYSTAALILGALVVAVLGLSTKQFFPHIAPEDALVTGFSKLLPYGLKQFGMVLLYGVALSSSDTVIFVLSSIFTRDLKNYTEKYSEESMKKLARFFMIIVVLFAIIIAVLYQNIISFGLAFGSLNLALFPVVFGTLYWQLKERAVFWALIVSLLSVAVLFIAKQFTPANSVIVLPIALISLLIFSKAFKRQELSNKSIL
jgi:SSS family solute:Na+ symporter